MKTDTTDTTLADDERAVRRLARARQSITDEQIEADRDRADRARLVAEIEQDAYEAGEDDYETRAEHVARGLEEPTWAWPLEGACSAYLNAVGTHTICARIGAPEEAWEDFGSVWWREFERGYSDAHDDDLGQHDECARVSLRDDEIMSATATLRAWAYAYSGYLRRTGETGPILAWPRYVKDAYQALGDDRAAIWAGIVAKAIS